MKAPVKERIIGIGFRDGLSNESIRAIHAQMPSLLAGAGDYEVVHTTEITRPVINHMPLPTEDGSMPDWSSVRLGVDRCHRFELAGGRYIQLTRRAVTFHLIEKNDDVTFSFSDLLSFYECAMGALAVPLDVLHQSALLRIHYLNHLEGDALRPFLSNAGSTLDIASLICMSRFGAHPSDFRPCPPSFQTTTYMLGDNSRITLNVDLAIPRTPDGKWIFDFPISAQVDGHRLTSENRWGSRDILPKMHMGIYQLFRGLLTENALRHMDIRCEVGK